MAQLIVTVNKLNKRSSVPASLADKRNVIGIVNRGFRFEGEEVLDVPNGAPGGWYVDRDRSFYWAGGVMPADLVAPVAPGLPVVPNAPVEPVVPPVAPIEPVVPVPPVVPVGGPAGELVLDGKPTFQWVMDLGLHDIWFGSQATKGEGVKVAVLDTGYLFTNKELNPVAVGLFGVKPPLNPPLLKPKDPLFPKMNDSFGHGTYCGCILSGRNDLDFIVGIAPASDLIVAKICDSGGFDETGLDTMLDAIEWAIGQGAEIISISYSMFANELSEDPAFFIAAQERLDRILEGRNVLVFAACGNNDAGVVRRADKYPASLTGVVSVGATHNKSLSAVTVLSGKTIVHAQGVDVESYGLGVQPEKQSGTSASTPIVAGIAALAVSAIKKKNNGLWDPKKLRALIEDGDPIVHGDPLVEADAVADSGRRKLINPNKIFQNL